MKQIPLTQGKFALVDNAEFIVRACNCHDDLLAVLQQARQLYDFRPYDEDEEILKVRSAIEAAIAKAEATQ